MVLTTENVNLIIIILISLGLIFLGGALFYQHSDAPAHERQPLLWAFAIALASGGGSVLVSLIYKSVLPCSIFKQMRDIKAQKI